jgi:hypothetical protein
MLIALSGCGGGGGDGPTAPQTFTVGGSISGLASGAQVTLLNGGGDPLTRDTNGNFTFAGQVPYNGSFAITVGVQPTGQVCTVFQGSGTNVTANVSSIRVTCSAQTFTIGGTISGLAAGTQVTLNNSGDPLVVSENGSFTFPNRVAYNAGYGVFVGIQPTGQTCTVTRGLGVAVTANISDILVVCSAQTFTVGGRVSGLPSGAQVTLLNNGSDALTINANGSFTFPVPVAYGGSYTVTVSNQPVGQICSVVQGSGTGVAFNILAVRVACSTQTYTVGGRISGLASGTQVTLLNNAGDPLTISANGDFSFATPVAYGGSYDVTIGAQPTGQSCTVSDGSGSNVITNIGGVGVSCVKSCTTTLSGVLSSNASYGATGSPYCISGSLQIPAGISATFEPGTSISNGRIVVQGLLSVAGNFAARVQMTDVEVVPAGQSNAPHNISISFANISGGAIYGPTGNAVVGSFNLTDSRVRNTNSYIYLAYPVGANLIARNVFIGAGGIYYALDYARNTDLSFSIVNNYFDSWPTEAAVLNYAQYGSGEALIQQNTFATTSKIAVKLPGGYTNTAMNAANNYWGTVVSSVIEQMIYDKFDDITAAGFVTYAPFLTGPAPGTPLP